METEEVKHWIKDNKDRIGIQDFEINDVRRGESNHNFIINSEGSKYVLRVSRDISRKNRLENESKALEILENKDIPNVPRQKFFERDTKFGALILESFVGSKDLEEAHELTDKQLQSLAELLAETHSIDIKTYNELFGEDNSPQKNLRTIYEEEFAEWSKRPYEEYLELVENGRSDLERFYEKQKQLLNEIPDKKVTQSFIHSDLGFNLRSKDDKTYVVDWEYGTAGYAGHDIMILFEHGKLTQQQREKFLEEYQKHRELEDVFEKIRSIHIGFLAFHDAVWAAKRVEQEPHKEDRKELLERKLEKLETFYKNRN